MSPFPILVSALVKRGNFGAHHSCSSPFLSTLARFPPPPQLEGEKWPKTVILVWSVAAAAVAPSSSKRPRPDYTGEKLPDWRYSDHRAPPGAASIPPPSSDTQKRSRGTYCFWEFVKFGSPQFYVPGGRDLPPYYPSREEERLGYCIVRDTEPIGASYDLYLHNGKCPRDRVGHYAKASRELQNPSSDGVLNLIDDGKNPDEFTRDAINSCIVKNQITKGKTDAFKGLRKHLLEDLEQTFPDEVEAYREVRATSAAESKRLAQSQGNLPNGDVKVKPEH